MAVYGLNSGWKIGGMIERCVSSKCQIQNLNYEPIFRILLLQFQFQIFLMGKLD